MTESEHVSAPKIEEKKIEPPHVIDDVKEVNAYDKDLEPNVAKSKSKLEEKAEVEPGEMQDELKLESLEEKAEAVPAAKQDELKAEPLEEKAEAEAAEKEDESKVKSIEEKAEEAEELPAKEVEATEVKKDEIVSDCRREEASEQYEVTEQIQKEAQAGESVEKAVSEKLPKEDNDATEESVAIESSEQVKSDVPKAEVEEKAVECYASVEANQEKEPAKVVRPGKIEEKTEMPESKPEDRIEDLITKDAPKEDVQVNKQKQSNNI